MTRYPELFAPFVLKGLPLTNRITMAPFFTGYACRRNRKPAAPRSRQGEEPVRGGRSDQPCRPYWVHRRTPGSVSLSNFEEP